MPKVTVNGTEVEVDKGTSILRAAAIAGYEVPHFCYHPALSAPANCRMCLVEVEGAPKLQPACYMPVNDGMIVHTESARCIKARKAVLEFILINHPVDCPICDKAGECKLQDYYFAYDAQESRMRAQKQSKVKVYPIGPRIVYDGERCILCTRCIRFCEEISYTSELTLKDRGDRVEIRTFPGKELDNAYSLCTVDVCPVGALTSRDFRFKCRVWLLTSSDSLCAGCATGCNIHLDHFRNEIQRYRPRNNPQVNEYWMCDPGRLTYKAIHTDRLLYPASNGIEVSWHEVGRQMAEKLSDLADGGARLAVVLSPQASCEDLFMAQAFFGAVAPGARFYVGGLPDGPGDKVQPGSPQDDGRLRLIDTDKNPNRAGLERIFSDHELRPCAQLLEDLASGTVDALYLMDSRLPLHAMERQRLVELVRGEGGAGRAELFVLQSMQAAELADVADVALPSCSHAEKQGTFVNSDGLLQPFDKAFEPHGASLPDWQILARLARALDLPLGKRYTFLHQLQSEMVERLEKTQPQAEEQPKTRHAVAPDVEAPPVAEQTIESTVSPAGDASTSRKEDKVRQAELVEATHEEAIETTPEDASDEA